MGRGPATLSAASRYATLLGHEFAVPAENRVGLDDRRHVLQSLFAQFVANGGQRLAFAVTQPDTPLDLVAKDTIFRNEIFITQLSFVRIKVVPDR